MELKNKLLNSLSYSSLPFSATQSHVRWENLSIKVRGKAVEKRKSKFNNGKTDDKQLLLSSTLSFSAGEVLAVRGASGCGKSTLLALLAGFIDRRIFKVLGKVYLFSQDADLLPLHRRNVGMLTQDHLLLPHFTVEENLLFAMKDSVPKWKRRQTIAKGLNQAALSGIEKQMPSSLSGGERARVAMLMTLVCRPRYLLLDEPFSRLDLKRRADFRNFVFQQVAAMQVPTVIVTHDEADIAPLREKRGSAFEREGKKGLVLREAVWENAKLKETKNKDACDDRQ